MNVQRAWALLVGSLLVAGTTSCTEKSKPVVEEPRPVVGQEEPAEEEPRPETSEPALSVTASKQVIAEIQGLGGSVEVDDEIPDKPVVEVRFSYTQVTDGGIKELQETLPRCEWYTGHRLPGEAQRHQRRQR